MYRYGTGWFSSADNDDNDDDELDGIESIINNDTADLELTEEEREKLQKLQSEIEKEAIAVLDSSKHKAKDILSRHVQIHILSFKIQLLQHVEYPDYIANRYIVIPRPLIKLSLEKIIFKQLFRDQHMKIHLSIKKIGVEDLWTEDTLFAEVIRSPESSLKSSTKITNPAFHLHFNTNPIRGIQPTLNIQSEKIQIMCPTELIQRIIIFFSTSLPDSNYLNSPKIIKKEDNTELLLNDVSNMSVSNSTVVSPISTPPSERNTLITTNNDEPRIGLNLSIDCKGIILATCENFNRKETELIVIDCNIVQWQRDVQHTPKLCVESRHRGSITQIGVYSTTMPSFICGSTSDRFYFTKPFDIEISLGIGKLMNPSTEPHVSCLNQDNFNNIAPYSLYNTLDCTTTPIIVTIAKQPLLLLKRIIDKAILSVSSPVSYPSKPLKSKTLKRNYKYTTWKPLYGAFSKEERNRNNQDDINIITTKNVFQSITIQCNQSSLIIVGSHDNNLSVIVEAELDESIIEFISYQTILGMKSSSIHYNLLGFNINDSYGTTFVSSELHSPNYFPNSPAPFGTPYTSFPLTRSRSDFPTSSSLTPLKSSEIVSRVFSPIDPDLGFFDNESKSTNINLTDTVLLRTPSQFLHSYEGSSFKRRKQNSVVTLNISFSEFNVDINFEMSKFSAIYSEEVLNLLVEDYGSLTNSREFHTSNSHLFSELSKEKAMWQLLYLKSVESLRKDFREKAVKEGISCIQFDSWDSWKQIGYLYKPIYQFHTSKYDLYSYFSLPNIKFNATFHCAIITFPHQNMNCNLDLVIPLSTLGYKRKRKSNSNCDLFKESNINLSVSQIQAVIAYSKPQEFNDESQEDSAFLSSDSEEIEEIITDEGNFNTKHIIALIQSIKMIGSVNTNPSIPKLNTSLDIDEFKIDSEAIHIKYLIEIGNDISKGSWLSKLKSIKSKSPRKKSKIAQSIGIFNIQFKKFSYSFRDKENILFAKVKLQKLGVCLKLLKEISAQINVKAIIGEDLTIKANELDHSYFLNCSSKASIDFIIKEKNGIISSSGNINDYHIQILDSLMYNINEYISLTKSHSNAIITKESSKKSKNTSLGFQIDKINIYNLTCSYERWEPSKSCELNLSSKNITISTIKDDFEIILSNTIAILCSKEERYHILESGSTKIQLGLLNQNTSITCNTNSLNANVSNNIISLFKFLFSKPSTKDKDIQKKSNDSSTKTIFSLNWYFYNSNVYFRTEKDPIVLLSFKTFQSLFIKNTEKTILALACDNGEIFYKDNDWIKVIRCYGSEYIKSNIPNLLSNASALCAWKWKKRKHITEIRIDNVENSIKPLPAAILAIIRICTSSKSSDKKKKIEKSKVKNYDTEYKISIQSIITSSPIPQPISSRPNSSIKCYGEKLNAIIKIQPADSEFNITSQYLNLTYNYNTSVQERSVELIEIFGNSIQLDKPDDSEGKLSVDSTVIKGTCPLPLVEELYAFTFDLIDYFKSIWRTDPSLKPRRFLLFTGDIKEINNYTNDSEDNYCIEFSNINFVRKFKNGYTWKSDELNCIKTITWRYSTIHSIRRISWNNEGYFPRASHVNLEYYDEENNNFISLLSPIQSNCSRNEVDLIIDSKNSAKIWRLVFYPPNNPDSNPWPWISSLCIFSDPSISLTIPSVDKFTALKLFVASQNINITLSSSIRARDNTIFVLDCKVFNLNLLFAKLNSIHPLSVSGFIQSYLNISYQDLALMKMAKFLEASPRVYIACDGQGKFAFRLFHLNNPVRLYLTRTVLQLLRNLSFYIEETIKELSGIPLETREDLAMFYHYTIVNHTETRISLTEILNRKEIEQTILFIEPLYTENWKWSLIENDNNINSTKERRLKLKCGDYSISNINLSKEGDQILKLKHNNMIDDEFTILMRIYKPNDTNSVSKTLEVEFLSAFEIKTNLSIPLHISISSPFNNNNNNEGRILNENTSLFYSPNNINECELKFKVTSSNIWRKFIISSKKQSYSSLQLLRPLSKTNEQYIWINIEVNNYNNFLHTKITFTPVFILKNNSGISLRWKIESKNICLSEGKLDKDSILPLYNNPRRILFLSLCSGLVPQDSCEWSPPYEINKYQNQFSVKLESGIGLLENEITCTSIPIDLNIQSKNTKLNTRILTLLVPVIITNLTSEGLFIGSIGNDKKLVSQLYFPPNYRLPFNLLNGNLVLFDYLKNDNGSNINNLRQTSKLLDNVQLMILDSNLKDGIYPIAFTTKNSNYTICNQYLISIESNINFEMKIHPPILIKNTLNIAIIIETIWISDPLLDKIYEENILEPIIIQSNQSISIHHWIMDKLESYSGTESISFLIRYDSIGWEDFECSLSNLYNNNIFHVKNKLTKQHDRIQVDINKTSIQGQHQIILSKAQPFPYNFINFTCDKILLLIKETEKEIDLNSCSSFPIDINSNRGISIAIRLTNRHMWSDYIHIDRPRNILLSLFGYHGGQSLKISIQYALGCATITFTKFEGIINQSIPFYSNSSIERESLKLGYYLSNSDINIIPINENKIISVENLCNLHTNNENNSKIITKTLQEYLIQQFPVSSGFCIETEFSKIIITFVNEQGKSLLETNASGITFSVSYYSPESESIKLNAKLQSIIIENCSRKSHIPLRWGTSDIIAFNCETYIPIPFHQHIQKLKITMAPLFLQLTGPFFTEIVKEAPAWLSAIHNPTAIKKRNTIPNKKNRYNNSKKSKSHFFINDLIINEWIIELSWVNFGTNVLPNIILPKKLLSVSNLRLSFNSFTYSGIPKDIIDLIEKLVNRYKKDFLWQLFPTIGSIDLIGNPTNMFREMKHYFIEYYHQIRWIDDRSFDSSLFLGDNIQNVNNINNQQIGLLKHTTSLLCGIFAAVIDSGICFNRALCDVFASIENFEDPIYSELLIESGSEKLKEFLNIARISLEDAVRNTIKNPMNGYYTNGISGIIEGSKTAISGWSSPCRAGLDLNVQVLLFLRNWLLRNNSLPEMISVNSYHQIESNLEIELYKDNNTNIINDFNQQKSKELLILWKEKDMIDNQDLLFSCKVNKITSQFNTILLHNRIIMITSSLIILSSGNNIKLCCSKLNLAKIETNKEELIISLWFIKQENEKYIEDAIPISDQLLLLQIQAISRISFSFLCYHLIGDRKSHNKLLCIDTK